mgnify:FL=1
MEINKKEVGQRIRDLRSSMGLNMEKLGKLIDDLPRSTVNNWERGINLPKQEILIRIAEIGIQRTNICYMEIKKINTFSTC